MELRRTTERDLSPQEAQEILNLQQAAFPQTPAFMTRRCVHDGPAPGDEWITARERGRLAASVRVLYRMILVGGVPCSIAGVGNVCSHPAVRGRGLAKACMQDVQRRLAEGEVDFGMLFCRGRVAEFYAKLGWIEVDNLVQDDGRPEGDASDPGSRKCLMIFPARRNRREWPLGPIDLKGRNW